MLNKINFLFVTLFSIGKLPKIPGSYASLVTTLFLYFLFHYLLFPPNIFLYILIIIFLISLISINFFIKNLDNKDPKEIVIDEFIGQSIPLLAMINIKLKLKLISTPFMDYPTEIWILLSFVLFRFFDILKPFPINLIDKKFKNGFGIILDDIIAGVFTTICIYIILSWI